jgi:predicted DNA-binding protein (MmcQ/YjbR family)
MDLHATPTGYGLGRHGWVTITLTGRLGAPRWQEVEEWVETSYTLVAPRRLARQVLDRD